MNLVDKLTKNIKRKFLPFATGLALSGLVAALPGKAEPATWADINGKIQYNGTPICTMVLANGQHMFTCGDSQGEYNLHVPLDSNGEITLYGFCSGLSPFKAVLTPEEAVNYDIDMVAPTSGSKEMNVKFRTEEGLNKKNWVRVYGTVENEYGTPLCTMALANGQKMFTCGDNQGKFDLEVPLNPDTKEITLYSFCSGMQPYKNTGVPEIIKERTNTYHETEGVRFSLNDYTLGELRLYVYPEGLLNSPGGESLFYWDDLKNNFNLMIVEDPNSEYASVLKIDSNNTKDGTGFYMPFYGTPPDIIKLSEGEPEYTAAQNAIDRIIKNENIFSSYWAPVDLSQEEDVIGFVKTPRKIIYQIASTGNMRDVFGHIGNQADDYLVYEGLPSGENIKTKFFTIFPLKEICYDGEDNDRDGEIDEGCLPPNRIEDFSWRNATINYNGVDITGDWTSSTKEKNFLGCNICTGAAGLVAIQHEMEVEAGNPNLNKRLSLQEILCNGATDCIGQHQSGHALDYVRDFGVYPESCWPFNGDENNCSNSCNGKEKTFIHSWGAITTIQEEWSSPQQIYELIAKNIREKGVLISGINTQGTIDNDGIYRCDNTITNHAVNIIGYHLVYENGEINRKKSYFEVDLITVPHKYVNVGLRNDVYSLECGLSGRPPEYVNLNAPKGE